MIAKIENGDLVNWKPYVASTIWFSGCNTSCSYCHNKGLLLPKYITSVERFLDMIPDSIEHVVLSGGEPTSSFQFLDTLKQLYYNNKGIRVYTNGLSYSYFDHGYIRSVVITPPEIALIHDNIFKEWRYNVTRISNLVSEVNIRIPNNVAAIHRFKEAMPGVLVEIFEVKE